MAQAKTTHKFLSVLLALVLAIGTCPTLAFAERTALSTGSGTTAAKHTPDPTTNCSSIVGTYQYTSNEGMYIERTDTFAYNDEWFTGPASTYNPHLATLSALTSMSSASLYFDKNQSDSSQNSKHVEAHLANMGFEDVAVNNYYNTEMMPNGAGVAVGHKTITDNGKDYTLIAIVPRSAIYKQEWSGNFTVGTSGLHQGFKAGRDEILRFVKNYVAQNGISGDVKIWTCGHSRGSALANTVGAFFCAGGANEYLDGISVSPEDVYAYTFATPTTVMAEGVTEAQLLSVEGGPRTSQDARYNRDAPAAEYVNTGTTVIDPHSATFNSVHNCAPGFDLITLLPPPVWGFTHFGTYQDITDGSSETKAKMLEELYNLDAESHFAYNGYINGGDEEDYHYYTFNIDTLEFERDDASGTITQADDYATRVNSFVHHGPTRDAYVEGGYQDMLIGLAGIYGMNENIIREIPSWITVDETTIKAALLSVLAYASERLIAEGSATNDAEAANIVLAQALEWLTGESLDPNTYTVDDFMHRFAKWVLNRIVPEEGVDEYGDPTVVGYTYKTEVAKFIHEGITNALVEAAGLDVETASTAAYQMFVLLGNDSYDERKTVYILLSVFVPELSVVGDGSGPGKDLIAALLPMLLTEKDAEGETIAEYATFAEAADAYLPRFIGALMDQILAQGRYTPGDTYYEDLKHHFEVVQAHPKQVRDMIMYLLLYTDGEPFSVKNSVRTASTFAAQVMKVASAHYNEGYVAWMRAQDAAYPAHSHNLVHHAAVSPTCTEDGTSEYWQCSECGLLFADAQGSVEIAAGDTVVAKLGHEWGPWMVTKQATTEAEGEEQRVCKHDASHIETRATPKVDPSPEPKPSPSPSPSPSPTPSPSPSPNNAKASGTSAGTTAAKATPARAATPTKTGASTKTGDTAPLAPLGACALLALLGCALARSRT